MYIDPYDLFFGFHIACIKYLNMVSHADLCSRIGSYLHIKKHCIKANPHQITVYSSV